MDKFMSYKNYSSVQGEDVPVTPDDNSAIAQGYLNNYVLTANTPKSISIPTDAKFALFNANADIWVRMGSAATIPTVDIINGTGAELNPSIRYCSAATTIGVISASAAKISVMFYS